MAMFRKLAVLAAAAEAARRYAKKNPAQASKHRAVCGRPDRALRTAVTGPTATSQGAR